MREPTRGEGDDGEGCGGEMVGRVRDLKATGGERDMMRGEEREKCLVQRSGGNNFRVIS